MGTEVRLWLVSRSRSHPSDDDSAGANLVGSDLYQKLQEYFIAHFKPMKEVCDLYPTYRAQFLTTM